MRLSLFILPVYLLHVFPNEAFFAALPARMIGTIEGLQQQGGSTAAIIQNARLQRGDTSMSLVEQPQSAQRSCDRRIFFSEGLRTVGGVSFFGLASVVLVPHRAVAEEEKPPPDWNTEFGAIRTGKERLLEDLRAQLVAEDWKGVMSIAREYDLSFRKEKMGKLRKKLPKEPKALKDDALKFTNDVTYDLIAINKAGRVEDKSRGLEVCDILEGDIHSFLSLEKRL